MKKNIFLFAALFCLISLTMRVNASEAKCIYYNPVNEEEIYTIEIKNKQITATTTLEEHDITGQKYFLNYSGLREGYFIKDGKYVCLEHLYSDLEEKPGTSDYNIVLKYQSGTDQLNLDSKSSFVKNDEVVTNPDIPADEPDYPEEEEGNVSYTELEMVQCGDTIIPAPIPPITRAFVTLIKIITPFVLIIMGMIDIVKAVTANDEKKMKEAQTTFVKRLIPAALIFLIITIFQLFVGIIADGAADSTALSNCIDCMISDASKCITSN